MPGNDAINRAEEVGLPPVIFLYTVDQIASMLNITEDSVMKTYLYFVGRSSGLKKTIHMEAVNIAAAGQPAEWRVNVGEFIRWCKRRGIKIRTMTHFS